MMLRPDPSVFIHDKALCESVDIGSGTRVWAFAHVMAGARVGAECNICDHAFLESGSVVGNRVTVKNNVLVWDGVTVEDEVFLGPNAVFTNDLRPRIKSKKAQEQFMPTRVRRGATIGANSTILCGLTIGAHAFIAAGSVVVGDVPSYALVAGNPARQIGWVCECGARLGADLACACEVRYVEDDTGCGLSRLAVGDKIGPLRDIR